MRPKHAVAIGLTALAIAGLGGILAVRNYINRNKTKPLKLSEIDLGKRIGCYLSKSMECKRLEEIEQYENGLLQFVIGEDDPFAWYIKNPKGGVNVSLDADKDGIADETRLFERDLEHYLRERTIHKDEETDIKYSYKTGYEHGIRSIDISESGLVKVGLSGDLAKLIDKERERYFVRVLIDSDLDGKVDISKFARIEGKEILVDTGYGVDELIEKGLQVGVIRTEEAEFRDGIVAKIYYLASVATTKKQ